MNDNLCPWGCGHEYAQLDQATENAHLRECPVFQNLPVALERDGRQYVALPDNPDILAERTRLN